MMTAAHCASINKEGFWNFGGGRYTDSQQCKWPQKYKKVEKTDVPKEEKTSTCCLPFFRKLSLK